MSRDFVVLVRAFLAQFFASDSVTSDHQLRQAMIGVLAFLVMPGFLIPFQLSSAFEFAAIRFPALLDPLTRLMVSIFVTYSMVTIGVIAAFAWDSLGFSRLDAMVLGPLPVRGRTVIAAKLVAMAIFLLAASAGINALTAVPFSMIASNHKAVVSAGRQMVAHMGATMCAATFVFCACVTLRALLGLMSRGRAAIASLVQFSLVSALLCFIVFVPTALQVVPVARAGRRAVQFAVRQQAIPAWSPTNWFLGLYEVLRGSGDGQFDRAAAQALVFTLAVVAAAILTTFVGYRRQLQLALTPAASTGARRAATVQRTIAALLTGRDPMARAISNFILATIARNRAQQAPIAINAAIGLAIAVAGLSRGAADIASLLRPRTAVLWIPLVLGYWTIIGLRAAFFVPSELPASWSFRSNAPDHARAYWSAVRASMIAFIVPPVLLIDLLLAPLLGWRMAVSYALVTSAVVILLAEVVALTIDFIPFTRAYRPGHAKLKTRWPLYLLGLYVFAFWPARLQLWTSGSAAGSLQLAAEVGVIIAVVDFAGRRRAARWSLACEEDTEDVFSRIAVLDLGNAAPLSGD
jgi:hypothetical protein